MRKAVALAGVIVAVCVGAVRASAQGLPTLIYSAAGGGGERPAAHAVSWGSKEGKYWDLKDATLPVPLRGHARGVILVFGNDHPNGIHFVVVDKSNGEGLPYDFPGADVEERLDKGEVLQAAVCHFGGGAEPQTLVALGSGAGDVSVNVFTYQRVLGAKRAGRGVNWSLAGRFSGTGHVVIASDSIRLGGASGLRHVWQKGAFAEAIR